MSLAGTAVALLAGGLAVLAWRDALRARERAVAVCRRVCQSYELQFLDETVALASVRPARTRRGHVGLRRVYSFDFSRDGAGRESGSITLLGDTVLAFYLPPAEAERLT